jgi:hypothetical protein
MSNPSQRKAFTSDRDGVSELGCHEIWNPTLRKKWDKTWDPFLISPKALNSAKVLCTITAEHGPSPKMPSSICRIMASVWSKTVSYKNECKETIPAFNSATIAARKIWFYRRIAD